MPSRRHAEVLGCIAANVRRLREKKGLTQEALAAAAGLDLSYEQRVERAATNLSIAVLVTLAEALDVPPARLLRAARMPRIVRGRPRKVARKTA